MHRMTLAFFLIAHFYAPKICQMLKCSKNRQKLQSNFVDVLFWTLKNFFFKKRAMSFAASRCALSNKKTFKSIELIEKENFGLQAKKTVSLEK